MNAIVTRRSVDGVEKLALRFPAGALKGAGATLAAAMSEEGRLIPGGPSTDRMSSRDIRSLPWRFESIVQEADDAFLVGPDVIGPDAIRANLDDSRGLEEGLSRLLVLARALSLLQAEGKLPRGIVSSGVLFAQDGGVLVLPPIAAAKALSARGAEARSAAVARLSSPRAVPPERGPESDASFLLAQAAYRFAAGKGAFELESAEPRGVAGAAPVAIATGLAAPRLDPALASLVDRALADPESASLSDWIAVLGAAHAAHWTRELPPGEEAELARRRDALESRLRARRRRAGFFRKRGGILIAAAVAIFVLALVAADMLRAQRDKPDFSRLTPRELAQRYYLAIDGMDMDSLEACGDRKAIENDLNYLVSLVVITRTRTAYEGKSPVVRARDWLAAGKPALAPADFLYGIAGLSLSGGEARADESVVSVRAEYSFWSLDRKEDPSGDPSKTVSAPFEQKRVDELALERGKKGGWRIVGLDRRILP
jgi:hypothetical protein